MIRHVVRYGPIRYAITTNYEKRGPFKGWDVCSEVEGFFNDGSKRLFTNWVASTETYEEANEIVKKLETYEEAHKFVERLEK